MSTECQRWGFQEVFWLQSPWSGPLCYTSSYYISALHYCGPVSVLLWSGVWLEIYISGAKRVFRLFWCSFRRNSVKCLRAVFERYRIMWFRVCSASVLCLYVFRQYGEGKTCSYPKGLVVLQTAPFGLTSSPFQGRWQCFDLCFGSLLVSNIGKCTFENLYPNSCFFFFFKMFVSVSLLEH